MKPVVTDALWERIAPLRPSANATSVAIPRA